MKRLIALTSVAALALTGCGSRSEQNTTTSADGTTVTIGFDGPLTGDLSALALGAKNSAQLAVDQANSARLVPGVTFKLKALDDQAQPSSGQQNATALVGDKTVLGLVGPLNSSVAQSVQQVLEQAKLGAVSPATTNPTLTQGEDWATGGKKRGFTTYFRTATTDAVQGPFAARYAHDDLKKNKVFVLDDKKAYGAGLSATFTTEFKRLGGDVVGTDHINSGEKDLSAVVTKIKSSGAELVYYGGEYPDAGPLAGQLHTAGVKAPLMGGDGISDPTFAKLAGDGGEGSLATTVGAPTDTTESGKKFAADYKAAGFKEEAGAYGPYAYDSTTALIQAIKTVVKDGKVPDDARAQVVAALQTTSFAGVTGPVAFDAFGDTTNLQLTVLQVKGGAWTAVKSGAFTPAP
ncbi:branched-chain amino acid ABC transporter substrate-binding protein [Actinocorallia lasiicapitis]